MDNNVSNAVKGLEKQVNLLALEFQDKENLIAFLEQIKRKEEETFAYTNQQAEPTYIDVTTEVLASPVKFKVRSGDLLDILKDECNNPIKLERAKGRLNKIKKLIEDYGTTKDEDNK